MHFHLVMFGFCVSAGQQHLFQQVTSAVLMPGAVHRPQVQQISNNVVTLSNVQSPAVYSAQLNRSITQSFQTFSMPVNATNNNIGICIFSYNVIHYFTILVHQSAGINHNVYVLFLGFIQIKA